MELKIEVMFYVYDKEFNKRIERHYTTVDRLCDGRDDFKYNEVDIVAKRLFTGVKDKNGIEVYSGDLIQFSNKLEWYRMPFQSNEEREKILTDHAKYPYERRVVDFPTDYEWLLSSEIQMYWEVIGNIYENPELLEA